MFRIATFILIKIPLLFVVRRVSRIQSNSEFINATKLEIGGKSFEIFGTETGT